MRRLMQAMQPQPTTTSHAAHARSHSSNSAHNNPNYIDEGLDLPRLPSPITYYHAHTHTRHSSSEGGDTPKPGMAMQTSSNTTASNDDSSNVETPRAQTGKPAIELTVHGVPSDEELGHSHSHAHAHHTHFDEEEHGLPPLASSSSSATLGMSSPLRPPSPSFPRHPYSPYSMSSNLSASPSPLLAAQGDQVTVATPSGQPVTLNLPHHLASAVAAGQAQIVFVNPDGTVPGNMGQHVGEGTTTSNTGGSSSSPNPGFSHMGLRQPYAFYDPVLGGLRVSPAPPSPPQYGFPGFSTSPLLLGLGTSSMDLAHDHPSPVHHQQQYMQQLQQQQQALQQQQAQQQAAEQQAQHQAAQQAAAEHQQHQHQQQLQVTELPTTTAAGTTTTTYLSQNGIPVQLIQPSGLQQYITLPNGLTGIVAGTVPDLGIRPDLLSSQLLLNPNFLGQLANLTSIPSVQPVSQEQPTMMWTIHTADGRAYNIPGTASGPLPEFLPGNVAAEQQQQQQQQVQQQQQQQRSLQLPRRTHAHRRTSSSSQTLFSATAGTSPPSSTASATSPALSHSSAGTPALGNLRSGSIPDELHQGFRQLTADPGYDSSSSSGERRRRRLMPVPELGGEMPFHDQSKLQGGQLVPIMKKKKERKHPGLGKADFGIQVQAKTRSSSSSSTSANMATTGNSTGSSSSGPAYDALFSSFAMAPRKRGRPRKPRPGEGSSSEESVPAMSFRCPTCDRCFNRLYNLKSHVRTHDNHRPFVCKSCGQAFTRNHDLTRYGFLFATRELGIEKKSDSFFSLCSN